MIRSNSHLPLAMISCTSRITELVGALLDVPSNRICVEQRRE